MDDADLSTPGLSPAPARDGDAYQVLARKYRPLTFASLIGQEAMVRTLTNAINQNRLAHAFVLTGVRGVGKTTTARIIARALNCVGGDGQGGPTISPCGVCGDCAAIAADRHTDVLEMDAASRTGVDDIREIIEGVRYKPASARFKVYIIDEVHMLSRNAFNALLKTLEEPPGHVKFIFATTEIRKVPVTVLSRCQRFDLRRVGAEDLARHFARIAENEGARVAEPALRLIGRAADGSVRDGLSLLDQAISMSDGEVDEAQVRSMLGLANRSQSFDLLEAVMKGGAPAALARLGSMYSDGADPSAILEDLLEIVHFLTRIKIVPAAADAPDVPEIERVRGKAMADGLAMPHLSRAWQMLLKGRREVDQAPSAIQAAEMVLVRLAYAASLPSPEDALKKLAETSADSQAPAPSPAPGAPGLGGPAQAPVPRAALHAGPVPEPLPDSVPRAAAKPAPPDFAAVAALADERKEGRLLADLVNNVHLIAFEPGRIEFRPAPRAPDDLAGRLAAFLMEETGMRWMVSVGNGQGLPTIAETRLAAKDAEKAEAAGHPMVRAVMDSFPGATLDEVRGIDLDKD